MNKSIILGLILASAGFSAKLFSQAQIQSLYFMDRVIQTNTMNPAMFPSGSFHIGLPSFALDAGNSGFALRDLIKVRDTDDSLYLDIPGVLSQLETENVMHARMRADLLTFHMRLKKLHITVSGAQHIDGSLAFPSDLLNFAWNGNRAYVGDTLQLSPSGKLNMYMEAAVGAAWDFGKFTVGAKYRQLLGQAYFETTRANATLYTDAEIFALDLHTDILLRTAGLPDLKIKTDSTDTSSAPFDFMNTLAGISNSGSAIDLGIVIRPLKHLQIAASAINLGSIHWTNNASEYSINGDFNFSGFGGLSEANMDSIKDSLIALFKPVKASTEFTTPLNKQIFLSGTYDFDSTLMLSMLLRFSPDEDLSPNFSFAVTKRLKKLLRIGFSYSIIDDRRNNIGVMFDLKLWKFQFFGVTDDVGTFLRPRDSRYLNWRGGINLFF